jgi:hypothetical protein
MIRQVLIEFALFAAPFVAYALFLWATRSGVLHPESWPAATVLWLCLASVLLVIGSFVVLAQFSGDPAGSTYVPAHIDHGRFVPGHTQ